MKIEIAFTGQSCTQEMAKNKIALVIDTLRATSVIIEALKNEADCVIPLKSIEDAVYYGKIDRDKKLLCGERNCEKIEGFDLGNSPLEFVRDTVKGKEIVLTTTNGTIAINNALSADDIYIMSYFNINAVADKLVSSDKDVLIICAGTVQKFSLDDSLCAGMFINAILSKRIVSLDDGALCMKNYADFSHPDIAENLKDTAHYKNLMSKGMSHDLEYCLRRDIYDIVPIFKNGKITL